jgi:hypothetical protein
LPHKPTGQAFIYLTIVFLMMGIIAQVKPFADFAINRLLMANEFITLCCAIIMLVASNPDVEPIYRRYLGFAIIGFVGLLIAYNFVYILIRTFRDLRRFYMKRRVDEWKDKQLNAIRPGSIVPGLKSILEEVIAEVADEDSFDDGRGQKIRRRRRGNTD